MANIKEITIIDLLTIEDKSNLILEMISKGIDFNNLEYEKQEEIVIEYLEKKKRRREENDKRSSNI